MHWIFRKPHFSVSLFLFSLSLRACVHVCVSPPHSPHSPPALRGAQRRCSDAFQLRVRLRPLGASRLHTLTPRCIRGASPASFHQFPPPPPLLWFFSCRRSGAGYGAVCDRSSGISMNMAFIGDADPFTAAIPATKVELTVSCRWVKHSCH